MVEPILALLANADIDSGQKISKNALLVMDLRLEVQTKLGLIFIISLTKNKVKLTMHILKHLHHYLVNGLTKS